MANIGGKNTVNMTFRKFDISRVKCEDICMAIGMRGSGKSFLIRDILYRQKGVPCGSIIAATDAVNRFYCSFIPQCLIYNEWDEQVVKDVLKRQKNLFIKYHDGLLSASVDRRYIVVFDDLLYCANIWKNTKCVRKLFMNGRHYKILYIISLQYPLGVDPSLRSNISYTFLMRDNKYRNKKIIYENYAGMFESFSQFCEIFDQITENFGCLVIDNKTQSNNLEDQVFWYKAEPHEDFQLFDRKYWELDRQIRLQRPKGWYDDDDSDDDDENKRRAKQKKKLRVVKFS